MTRMCSWATEGGRDAGDDAVTVADGGAERAAAGVALGEQSAEHEHTAEELADAASCRAALSQAQRAQYGRWCKQLIGEDLRAPARCPCALMTAARAARAQTRAVPSSSEGAGSRAPSSPLTAAAA
jgi:hypothetical protein